MPATAAILRISLRWRSRVGSREAGRSWSRGAEPRFQDLPRSERQRGIARRSAPASRQCKGSAVSVAPAMSSRKQWHDNDMRRRHAHSIAPLPNAGSSPRTHPSNEPDLRVPSPLLRLTPPAPPSTVRARCDRRRAGKASPRLGSLGCPRGAAPRHARARRLLRPQAGDAHGGQRHGVGRRRLRHRRRPRARRRRAPLRAQDRSKGCWRRTRPTATSCSPPRRGFTQYAYGFVQMPADAPRRRRFRARRGASGSAPSSSTCGRAATPCAASRPATPASESACKTIPTAAAAELTREDAAARLLDRRVLGRRHRPRQGPPRPARRPAGRARAARARARARRGVGSRGRAPGVHHPGGGDAGRAIRWRRPSDTSRARSSSRAGSDASPYVTYAEAIAVPAQDRAAFEAMLDKALAVDCRRRAPAAARQHPGATQGAPAASASRRLLPRRRAGGRRATSPRPTTRVRRPPTTTEIPSHEPTPVPPRRARRGAARCAAAGGRGRQADQARHPRARGLGVGQGAQGARRRRRQADRRPRRAPHLPRRHRRRRPRRGAQAAHRPAAGGDALGGRAAGHRRRLRRLHHPALLRFLRRAVRA